MRSVVAEGVTFGVAEPVDEGVAKTTVAEPPAGTRKACSPPVGFGR